ncbi:MAG: hypothetical protein ACRDRP_23155 [Pseudonocardiaceae bacterium]
MYPVEFVVDVTPGVACGVLDHPQQQQPGPGAAQPWLGLEAAEEFLAPAGRSSCQNRR